MAEHEQKKKSISPIGVLLAECDGFVVNHVPVFDGAWKLEVVIDEERIDTSIDLESLASLRGGPTISGLGIMEVLAKLEPVILSVGMLIHPTHDLKKLMKYVSTNMNVIISSLEKSTGANLKPGQKQGGQNMGQLSPEQMAAIKEAEQRMAQQQQQQQQSQIYRPKF